MTPGSSGISQIQRPSIFFLNFDNEIHSVFPLYMRSIGILSPQPGIANISVRRCQNDINSLVSDFFTEKCDACQES
jgi:hypothetical protein